MSDMTTCLNDLSFIPSNNEQNEPTQGDIDETSNEQTQAKCNEFEELYASANMELIFPKRAFPTKLGYKLPPSYYEIKKTFKMIRFERSHCSQRTNDLAFATEKKYTENDFWPPNPGKDIDVYSSLCIDDLKDLWEHSKYASRNAIKGQVLADFKADTVTGDDSAIGRTPSPKVTLDPKEVPESSKGRKEQASLDPMAEADTWKFYTARSI
ncbi:hypothetical protein Tco_0092688 [Tanacetum coccineum]